MEKKSNQELHNKFLIILVCSVRTGKYLPSVFVHRSERVTKKRDLYEKTKGKYFLVRTSQSVDKYLLLA